MNIEKPGAMYLERLRALRFNLHYGDEATQEQLDRLIEELQDDREMLRPREKDEYFMIVDNDGNTSDKYAPRWICHLLNLRHKVAHVLLKWHSPGLGTIYVLQVRSWEKADHPGHLDISVGGHVTGKVATDPLETAYTEMEEELGITRSDLVKNKLEFRKGYVNYNKKEDQNFFNAEWRDVYVGELNQESVNKIRFNDKEVVGIYLCPESEIKNLLKQKIIPIANGLECSLPLCLEPEQENEETE